MRKIEYPIGVAKEKLLKILLKETKPIELPVLESKLHFISPLNKQYSRRAIVAALESLYKKGEINIFIEKTASKDRSVKKTITIEAIKGEKTIAAKTITEDQAGKKDFEKASQNPFSSVYNTIREYSVIIERKKKKGENNRMKISYLRKKSNERYGRKIGKRIFANILNNLEKNAMIKIIAPQQVENKSPKNKYIEIDIPRVKAI